MKFAHLLRHLNRRAVLSVSEFKTLQTFRCNKSKSSFEVEGCSDVATMRPIDENKSNRLVWVDLEMTGLEVEKDHILEIACLITDKDLSIVAEGPDLVIHQSDDVLKGMIEWCIQHHGESGLTEASKNSKIDLGEAEKMVLEFVQQYTPKGECPIAGNSVGMDKRFIDRYMPLLAEHLHYRVVDVSTIKEVCRRWYPDDFKSAPAKKCRHRAMDDIRESIEELKYYRNSIFK